MKNKSNFDNRPIGVFDSGLGGLTVVKQIVKLMPNEDIVYLGDTARVPYGTRSKEVIKKFSLEDARFLLKHNIKALVIACNTASAIAGDTLKKTLDIPIFEVISGAAKNAVSLSKNKKIGVIGTRATIESGAYQAKINKINSQIKVISGACPLFVPFIEEGNTKSKSLDLIAKDYLTPIINEGIDTLILGCTHYPIIKEVIKNNLGFKKIVLIDPGQVESENILKFLKDKKMQNQQKTKGRVKYFVTDVTKRFKTVAEMFLDDKIHGSLKKVSL